MRQRDGFWMHSPVLASGDRWFGMDVGVAEIFNLLDGEILKW